MVYTFNFTATIILESENIWAIIFCFDFPARHLLSNQSATVTGTSTSIDPFFSSFGYVQCGTTTEKKRNTRTTFYCRLYAIKNHMVLLVGVVILTLS